MHFVTQQRAQQQNQHHQQQQKSSTSSSSSSLASSSSCSGSGSGTGLGSRLVTLRKSSSQGALPKSLATAQSLFHRPSHSKHKRTASLNAAPMIKDIDITNPTTSSVTITTATADKPSSSRTPANANMIPETTTQPDQLQSQSASPSQSELQSQSQPPLQSQSQSQAQDCPESSPPPQQQQQHSQPEEELLTDAWSAEKTTTAAGSNGGDRRDSITEEITITSTTNGTLSTKLLTIQEATGSLEHSSVSIQLSSKQNASTAPATGGGGGSPPGSASLSAQRNESSGSNNSLTQAVSSTSPPTSSSAAQGATPTINIVGSESSRDQQAQSADSNGFTAPAGGSCTDSPSSRKSSTSSKGKGAASQPKLSASSNGREEDTTTAQHRLSDLTPHELSLLRVDRDQQQVTSSSSATSNEKPAKPSRLSERAKKKSWYNVIYPNYKSRAEDFKKLFKDVPNDERLIVDYSCALQRDILVQGRLYVSQNYVCFHANIFSWETYVSIKWKDVTAITKEKTALVIPNAISIASGRDKYFFATFTSRDKSFLMLFRVWQNTLMNKQFSPQEIWKYVHNCYGEELGLTTDDEDYIDPTLDNDNETDFDFQTAIDDDSQSQRQSQQSNQSTQSNPQLPPPQSGNSSASSGGGAVRASAPRKSKTKYFFNSSKSSANASASGSDNNKTRESSRKLNKKMKQNAKELTLSSVKPAEQSVSVTMAPVASAASSSSTAGSTSTASSSTIANHTAGSGSGSGSGTAAASGSDKKSAEKKVSTSSNSSAIAAAASAAAAAASSAATSVSGMEPKMESKRKPSKKGGKNLDETVPTDVSDSSDSEENNVPFVPTTECTSTHEGRQIVHTILPISVDTLFNLLFSKSKFITDFHAMRKSTDLILGEWSRNEEGLNVRTVNVTVQLAASVGPKTSKVTEYQTMRECSKPGELYSIDVNSVNAGIPYADSFSVLIHFCLARTVDDHTMLSIHTQIKYKKSIWGVVKGFIEKNTWAGLEDFFGAQLHALQSETCIPPAKGKGRRPRRGMNQQSAKTTTTATSTDNDSIKEAPHNPHQSQTQHPTQHLAQHQHLHMHHHHHHHGASQQHREHDHRHSHHHHHQHHQLNHHHQHQSHWHHRKAIFQSTSRGTATQIRPLEEAGGTAQAGSMAGLLAGGDPLETQLLSAAGVAGTAVGAASSHPLLLESGGKLQQQQQLHHHQQHQQHKQQQQQQQLHLGGGGDGQQLAMGRGPQGHSRLKHKGLSLLVILLLCLMLALNVILLLKLWKLEDRIDVDLSRRARLPSLAALKELPNTNQEWLELLRDQEMAHEDELHKWQQVLQTAIELLKKVSIVCQKIYNDDTLRQSVESMATAAAATPHTEF